MNKPLEEVPHLFANGKFKAKYGEGEKFEYDYLLDGVVNRMGLLLILKDPNKPKEFEVEPNECTLIARPIEDMTDEESDKLMGLSIYKGGKEVITRDGLIYLLSIGCYPFSQEDFNNGTVIDATTL